MKIEERNKKQCFEVPAGYFEDFHRQLSSKLPKDKPSKRIIPPIFKYIGYAASIALLLFIGNTALHNTEEGDAISNNLKGEEVVQTTANDNETAEDVYIDEVLNNYPIDDYTFYCYMTDSEY